MDASFGDLNNLLTQQPENPAITVLKREMERQAQDLIRVANILDEDYYVGWDSRLFLVPGRTHNSGEGDGQTLLPRYLAKKYVKEMVNKITEMKRILAVKEANAERVTNRQAPMVNGDRDWERFEGRWNVDNIEYANKLERVLWVKVEKRYGIEPLAPRNDAPRELSLEERLDKLSDLEATLTANLEDLEAPVKADKAPDTKEDTLIKEKLSGIDELLADKNVFALHKIAKEQGLETDKHDTKNDLIAKLSRKS